MKGIATTTAAVASALKLSTREADRWFRWLMEESSKMEVTTSVANLPHNKHLNRSALPAWFSLKYLSSEELVLVEIYNYFANLIKGLPQTWQLW